MRHLPLLLAACLGLAALIVGAGAQAAPTERAPRGPEPAAGQRLAERSLQAKAPAAALELTIGEPPAVALSQIVPTRRISVPFGFHTPLLLDVERQTVAVAGPGACGPDGQVTIEVTVTQAASGAAAAGQTELPCAGADDLWATTVARESGPTLAPGPARACGVATVRVGEEVTDSLEWCRDLTLHVPVYLPLIITS